MNKLFDLTGKVAVITGASGFLGRYFVEGLKLSGATVLGLDINPPADILDITDEKAINEWVNKTVKKYQHIDVLVNNAANQSTNFTSMENFPLSEWEQEIKVNLTGTFLMSRAVGLQMVKQNQGSIINLASIHGLQAPDFSVYESTKIKGSPLVYTVTKAGIIGMTKYLASYWGKYQVRVNALIPGGVENNQDKNFIQNYSKKVPLKRMAKPEDLIGAIIFLASDASTYITGLNLVVDGGLTSKA